MKRKANTEAEERELEEAPVPLEERVEGAEPAARPRAKGSAKSKAKAKAKRKTKARAKAHRKVMAKGAAKPGSGGEPRGPGGASEPPSAPGDSPPEASSPPDARKERVLHTRVPAVLEQELKRLAVNLRVPVSNVVRTILEDTLDAINSMGRIAEGELRSAAESLSRRRAALSRPHGRSEPQPERKAGSKAAPGPRAEPSAAVPAAVPEGAPPGGSGEPGDGNPARPSSPDSVLAGVIGFQPMLLARTERCAVCDSGLAAGDQAYLGMRETPGPRVIIDQACLPIPAADDQEVPHGD